MLRAGVPLRGVLARDRAPGAGTSPRFRYSPTICYLDTFPTFLYTPHLKHHSTRVFARDADPEYTRWSDRPAIDIVRYILFVIGVFPGLLVVRLGFLPVLGPLLGRRARGWIDEKASTLSSNRKYRRMIRDDADAKSKLARNSVQGLHVRANRRRG